MDRNDASTGAAAAVAAPVEELARARDGEGMARLVTRSVAIAERVIPMRVLTNLTER
jgi:hypothetical protein